uniref:Uncharacterized protein n=1 Tax=Oryzias melastigma TaxID=30732 RepID=A0A3B3BT94_ORYME
YFLSFYFNFLDLRTLKRHQFSQDVPDNLSTDERRALRQLSNNPNIIIKPADKGSKIVIMDRQQYLTEAYRQLNNDKYYKLITEPLQPTTQKTIRTFIETLYSKKYISAKQRDFLYGPELPRPRQFYLLPKIHKKQILGLFPLKFLPAAP